MAETELQKIGRYELVRQIGEGAYSKVYEARDPFIGRNVAVKVMKDVTLSHRLKAEAQHLGMLTDDPHILQIYDAGRECGVNNDFLEYLVLEKADSSLKDEIDSGRSKADWRRAVNWTVEMLEGLESIHAKSENGGEYVHRDVKPSNIFLKDGKVKVGDFNLVTDEECADFAGSVMQSALAPTEKSGMLIGTYAYMSPEQKRGKTATVQSNVYNAGLILTELLTGIRMDELGRKSVAKFDAPKWLDDVIAQATEFMPDNRYQTAEEFADELRKGLDGGFDGPPLYKKVLDTVERGATQTVKGIWKGAKFTAGVATAPFWLPVWFGKKWYEAPHGSDTEFNFGTATVLSALAFYIAAPIAGLVQNEKHYEGKTRQVAEQVFAQQPDSVQLAYLVGEQISIVKLNKILSGEAKPTLLPVSNAKRILGYENDELYFVASGDNPKGVSNKNEQVFKYNCKTGNLEGLIDYTNAANGWLMNKIMDMNGSRTYLAQNSKGEKRVKIGTMSSSDDFLLDEKGNAWLDNSGSWFPISKQNMVPGSNLVIDDSGVNVQVYDKNDMTGWGDLEMFIGAQPVLIQTGDAR